MLSVVTVVWNDPSGLRNTIRSMANLPGRIPFEHLIVDSSPECHESIYSEVPEDYPMRRLQTPKAGIYSAMNIGAKAAVGSQLWFLNAGDTLINADSLVSALELLSVNSRAIICGPVLVRDHGGEVIINCPDFSRGTYGKNRMCHQGVVYPRKLFCEFSAYDTRFKIAADFHLHLKMFLNGIELVRYSHSFACFELGGASSRIRPALKEFSRIQKELNEGTIDGFFRQACLLKDGGGIFLSFLARKLLGRAVHHRLKKIVKERE